jgi:hypothetical protein
VTAEPEVNIDSSRRGPIKTQSITRTHTYNRIVSSFSSSVEQESSPTVLSSAGLGMPGTHSWTSTETYTSDLVTAEPEVNIDSSRRGPIMTLSETPSKEQHGNGTNKSYTHTTALYLLLLPV